MSEWNSANDVDNNDKGDRMVTVVVVVTMMVTMTLVVVWRKQW